MRGVVQSIGRGWIGTDIRGVGRMTFGVIWVSAYPAKFI